MGRLVKQWLIAVIVLASVQTVQAEPGITKVTEIEGISEYRLDNGLVVLLFPDPTKETVTVNVTYKVGSKHEGYGETGMAHLLEHLLFKGSTNHPDIPSELSARGARPNGTTSIDRTNYFETFAATDDNIDWALSLEADRMVNSFVAQEDLDSEMTVVRNEFERGENNPLRVLTQRIRSSAYQWHNNGNATIGARSDIENVPIEDLRAFYKKYYQPDNAVLTVAGQFDEKDMIERVNRVFGQIPRPDRVLNPLYTQEPAQDGERSVTVRRAGDVQWFAAAYHIPAGAHADYAPMDLLTRILGDTPRGRLHKNLVENQLAVRSFAYAMQLQDPGLAIMGAQVDRDGDLERTRQVFLDTVENLKQEPITDQEVERAKRNLLRQYQLAFNSSERMAIMLSEYIGMGDWRLMFLTRDRLEEVQTADVQRVAETYLIPSNRTEGRFIPTDNAERVRIPQTKDVDTLLEGYTGREGRALGEAFDPSFENIATRTQSLSLTNGARVAFLPKKTRGKSVTMRLRLQFGTEDALLGKRAVGDAVGSMLMRGTSKYSRQELQDLLDELQASVKIGGNSIGAYALVETTQDNLLPVLELVAHILQSPAFVEEELEQLRELHIANLDSARQEPQALVSRELGRHFNGFDANHPFYVPTIEEEINAFRALELADLKAFHKRFYGANQMQVAVVGQFDPEGVSASLQQHFGQWGSSESYTRIARPHRLLEGVQQSLNTPDKESAAIAMRLSLPVGKTDVDAPALSVGTYIFGGGFLNSRLATRLRQQEGLSYSVGAWLSMNAIDARSEFNTFAIAAPQNMAAAERGMKEELVRLLEDGISEEELAAAKSGLLQSARVSRSDNTSLAADLTNDLFLGRTMAWHEDYEKRLQALTPEQVQAAMKRHIDPKQLSVVKAGDLLKAEQKAPSTSPASEVSSQ